MAQPPLSQAIRKLEDELGMQLFERTSRAVAPTEAGRVLAEEARKVLARVEFAVAEARRSVASPGLRIGCFPVLGFERLQSFLSGLRRLAPDTETQVAHLLALDQVGRLRGGELDLGIFHGAEEHDGIETAPLFRGEPLVALLHVDHPLAAKRTLGPADLREETLVIGPRTVNPALHGRVLALIAERGYRFAATREAGGSSPRDLVLAAAEGLGIPFAPLTADDLGGAESSVVCCQLDPRPLMPEIVLGWRREPPRVLRAVLPAVRDLGRELRLQQA